MKYETKSVNIRWLYLAVGVVGMLCAGIIYAWSILKAPLASQFGWSPSNLTLNFTLTMCFFCLGGTAGGILSKRIGARLSLIIAAVFACCAFLLTSRLSGSSVGMLYLTYGVLGGTGIGIAYNVIISTTSAWFPDKKGTCSGCLMMGFGASALVLGNVAGSLIQSPTVGWRSAYVILGIALGVVLLVTSFIIRLPGEDVSLPQAAKKAEISSDSSKILEYTPGQMVRRFTFWRAFVCILFLAAVGSSVISFARDLALSVGAGAALATSLVGVLSMCNGLGRIITGALFDSLGRRKTMLMANCLTIVAAGVMLLSVVSGSLPVLVIGLCLTGLSYGTCPTVSSAFTSNFYGTLNFPVNFSIMNFNVMGASLMATVSSMLFTSTGSYTAPFLMLLALSVIALILNISIRRP